MKRKGVNMKKVISILVLLAAIFVVNCGSSEVREDLPIQIPEDIDTSQANQMVNNAQKMLDKAKADKVNEYAAEEILKAEQYINTARRALNEEEEVPAYFAAGKGIAYIKLARNIEALKKAQKHAKQVEAELK